MTPEEGLKHPWLAKNKNSMSQFNDDIVQAVISEGNSQLSSRKQSMSKLPGLKGLSH